MLLRMLNKYKLFLKKLKKIAKGIRKSPKRWDIFQNVFKELFPNKNIKKIKISNATRWNSLL